VLLPPGAAAQHFCPPPRLSLLPPLPLPAAAVAQLRSAGYTAGGQSSLFSHCFSNCTAELCLPKQTGIV
jgi:hypothetical protein